MQTPSIYKLYKRLGQSIADVVGHPDCPVKLYNSLTQLTMDFDNDCADSQNREHFYAKHIFPQVLIDLTVQEREDQSKEPENTKGCPTSFGEIFENILHSFNGMSEAQRNKTINILRSNYEAGDYINQIEIPE